MGPTILYPTHTIERSCKQYIEPYFTFDVLDGKIAKKYMGMEEAGCQCIISTHESSKEDVKGNKSSIGSVGKPIMRPFSDSL